MELKIKRHPRVSALAKRLLLKTRRSIMENRRAYDQSVPGKRLNHRPTCSSPACLVGWMLYHAGRSLSVGKRFQLLTRYNEGYNYRSPAVLRHLGLTRRQAELLFHHGNWPLKPGTRHQYFSTQAPDRIRHFIVTAE